MEPNLVHDLEEHVDAAIAKVLREYFQGTPISRRTTHLMAKAAVTVFEAVEEKLAAGKPRDVGR
jgi:hypothetical protein